MLKKMLPFLLLLLLPQIVWGQEETTTVPDLSGMNVPAAAAMLNRNALNLGTQANEPWTAEAGVAENTISAQSVAPGETVARGTTIDITVLRSNNMTLIYDDNDITLINRSGGTLTLGGIVFSTIESTTAASFNGNRWGGALNAGGCGQLWSVGRTGAKDVEGCESINWLTTNQPAQHFWTALNGVTSFSVSQNGILRAECPAAQAGAEPITCDFFMEAAGAIEAIPYIYMVYTTTSFVILNNSDDKWLPLTGLVMELGSGGTLTINPDPTAYTISSGFGRPDLLAPGQCLLIVGFEVPVEPPQPCDIVVAFVYPAAGGYFWLQDFLIDGVTDDQQHRCTAAVEGRMTICIMPR